MKIYQKKQYNVLDSSSLEELRLCYQLFQKETKKNTPLVSILIPTYKTNKKHLTECINSILNQTYENWELLIFDDCPTDTVVEKLIKSFPDKRIKYFRNKTNLGIAKTRNNLMRKASGDYLSVMDHDDMMSSDRLERQVIYMELNPTVGLCGCAYERIGNLQKKKTIYPPKKSDDIKAGLFFKCTMHHPSIMIRSEIIKQHKIQYNSDYISVNDRQLYLDLMPYTEFHNLPQALTKYRIHSGMTSKTKQLEIQSEQKSLRDGMLLRMGAKLSEEELSVLNNFVLKGRCRIKNIETLIQIERLLSKLNNINLKCGYFPTEAFSKLCAQYLIKRSLNAAIYGKISSRQLLKQTKLNLTGIKIPLPLKILNYVYSFTMKG